jgi:nucleotide-binding universal stress UspA family protein
MNAGHILVGVDGSPASVAALDAAVREGALRGLTVHIRHVSRDRAGSEAVLSGAVEHARRCSDRVSVAGEVVIGDPASVLICQSGAAELVLVGHRGHGGFAELLLGSVALKVAGHAACPVIVTRGPAPSTGDVVVGVDGSPANRPAVGFAFAEAALRGTGVVAVHATAGAELTGPSDLLIYDPDQEHAFEASVLDDAVAEWAPRYPQVPVHTRLLRARPAPALVAASRQAQLLVAGTRGLGGVPGLRLGSVTHALLHHCACPVAVVGHRHDPGASEPGS